MGLKGFICLGQLHTLWKKAVIQIPSLVLPTFEMLIAKYIACMRVYQHVRRCMGRVAIFLKFLQRYATHLLWLCSCMKSTCTECRTEERFCIRKCCKFNRLSMHKHNAIILQTQCYHTSTALKILLCQLLNRTVSTGSIQWNRLWFQELMESQWNHGMRFLGSLFSSCLPVQIPFPIN